jgi:hypothetical protein
MSTNLSFESQTQAYSTWGDKLLQHTDRLAELQQQRLIRPITIQLAPTELCDSDCPFCSVQERPIKQRIPWPAIQRGLREFKELGAKSLELTGGGNPLLYRDSGYTINDIISYAASLDYKIGIITNSENLPRHIDSGLIPAISWVRISLIKLDEGKQPSDYCLKGFEGKVAFSYIVYNGTTSASIERIAQLVELHTHIKFVRIASDCLTEQSMTIKQQWGGVVAALDKHSKWFIKEIGDNFHPYLEGCWVGGIRPYWVHDGIYICTSHVLKHRTYHPTWKLCGHANITATWQEMSRRMADGKPPYNIDIASECWHCYYANNNKLLASVINELPDKDFA